MLRLREKINNFKLKMLVKIETECLKKMIQHAETPYEEYIAKDALTVLERNYAKLNELFKQMDTMNDDELNSAKDHLHDLVNEIKRKFDIVYNY